MEYQKGERIYMTKPKGKRLIEIKSGGMDFEYEVVETNAPDEEIKKAIIYQETGSEKWVRTSYEYLNRVGYDTNAIEIENSVNPDTVVDAIFDIEDIMEKEGWEMKETSTGIYLYMKDGYVEIPIIRRTATKKKFDIPLLAASVAIAYFSKIISIKDAKKNLILGGWLIGGDDNEEVIAYLMSQLAGNEKFFEILEKNNFPNVLKYIAMLDIRNDVDYFCQVHCVEYNVLGMTGWHKPLSRIIADMNKGKVEIVKDDLNHNIHIVTELDNYYLKTIKTETLNCFEIERSNT